MSFLKSVGIDVGIVQKSLNHKIDTLDAEGVAYEPVSLGNWGVCGCTSLGNVQTALDTLARVRAIDVDDVNDLDNRVSTLETGSGSGSGSGLDDWSEDSNGHLLPDTNDSQDIGNASQKVRDLYLGPNSLKIVDADDSIASYGKDWFEGRASKVSLGNVDTRLQSQETLSAYTTANLPSNATKGTTVLVEDGNETGNGVALAYWFNGVWYRSSDNAVLADRTIDIYLVAGQSNAHGHAVVSDLANTLILSNKDDIVLGDSIKFTADRTMTDINGANQVTFQSGTFHEITYLANATFRITYNGNEYAFNRQSTTPDWGFYKVTDETTQDGLFYTSWHQGTSNASSEQYYSDWANSLVAGATRGDDNNLNLGDSNYFGPEIGFASKVNEIGLTNRGFGIIKHAIGASSLIDDGSSDGGLSDWDLTATGDRRGDAYRAFKRAITDATDKLSALGYGYNLKGMIWWQGESGGAVSDLIAFISDFRNYLDTNYNLSVPKEQFPIVITGTDTIWGTDYEDDVANQDQYIGFVNAEDFGQTGGGGIHVGSSTNSGVADRDSDGINDMFEIGEQYAVQMEKAQTGETSGWVPVSTDTQFWYDADDVSTVSTDANTGFVTQVDDKSPNSVYLQPTSGAEVEHVLDSSLDRHVLRFSNNSDSIQQHNANSQYNGTQDWFIVLKALPNGGTHGIWAGTLGKYITMIPGANNRFNMYWGSEYVTSLLHPSSAYDQLSMFCIRHNFSGSHCSSWCNGTQIDAQRVVTDSSYDLTNANMKHSFMEQAGGSPKTNGDFCEAIISMDLSSRTKIEGYLAHKWGIDGLLPTSHAYHSAPP